MIIKTEIEMDVNIKDTDTQGKNTYLVALLCGGVMEDPDFHYEDYQIIHADSTKEAKEKYDKINKCSYYYGEVIQQMK